MGIVGVDPLVGSYKLSSTDSCVNGEILCRDNLKLSSRISAFVWMFVRRIRSRPDKWWLEFHTGTNSVGHKRKNESIQMFEEFFWTPPMFSLRLCSWWGDDPSKKTWIGYREAASGGETQDASLVNVKWETERCEKQNGWVGWGGGNNSKTKLFRPERLEKYANKNKALSALPIMTEYMNQSLNGPSLSFVSSWITINYRQIRKESLHDD